MKYDASNPSLDPFIRSILLSLAIQDAIDSSSNQSAIIELCSNAIKATHDAARNGDITFDIKWNQLIRKYPPSNGFHIQLNSPGSYSDGDTFRSYDRWCCIIQRGENEKATRVTKFFGEGYGDTASDAIHNAMVDIEEKKGRF